MSAETPADRARRLLEGATPGPWWPSRHNGPNDVDRGKIWGFRAGPPPVQAIVVGEVNRFIGTAADQKIMAAAPDLARDLIAESEAHEMTRAALAAVERERDEARAERDALQGLRCLACGGTGLGLGDSPCDACQGGAR